MRLARGDYGAVCEYERDPAEAARRFADAGFSRLHIVDLDAARDGGEGNAATVAKVLRAVCGRMQTQVGGGLRDDAALRRAEDAGADFMILGTAAARDREWREDTIRARPGKIMLALDVRGGDLAGARAAVSGWQGEAETTAAEYLLQMRAAPPVAVICTDINRDGVMEGPNLSQVRAAAAAAQCPLIASGGVRGTDDLRALAEVPNVAGAVVGRALYEGGADLRAFAGFSFSAGGAENAA